MQISFQNMKLTNIWFSQCDTEISANSMTISQQRLLLIAHLRRSDMTTLLTRLLRPLTCAHDAPFRRDRGLSLTLKNDIYTQ